jgi:hypothetical protein
LFIIFRKYAIYIVQLMRNFVFIVTFKNLGAHYVRCLRNSGKNTVPFFFNSGLLLIEVWVTAYETTQGHDPLIPHHNENVAPRNVAVVYLTLLRVWEVVSSKLGQDTGYLDSTYLVVLLIPSTKIPG